MTRVSVEDISVVIPVFKAEAYIENAVESAANQYGVLEVLLVEDGSPDDSLEKCRLLASKYEKVKVYQHERGVNKGAGASRNLGIRNAGGELIAFLDADDIYLENRFENDLKVFSENERVDGVYNAIGAKFLDDAGRDRYLNQGFSEDQLTTVTKQLGPNELFENMAPIGACGYFSGDGLVVKKTALERVGSFDTELEISQDTLLWLQLSLTSNLYPGKLDEPVAIRGVACGNRISDTVKRDRLRLLLYKKLYEWAKSNGVKKDYLEIIWNKLYHTTMKYSNTANVIEIIKHCFFYPEVVFYKSFRDKFIKKL